MRNNILITGGSGYVGTRLIFRLLANSTHNIINYDLSIFGDQHLPRHAKFIYVKGDLRDKNKFKKALTDNKIDTVIHLACISNDPTFELNNTLSKQINFDCFEDLVSISKNNGVSKFIYASTCSVYGISDTPYVTEDHPLLPITDYNKYKALCEPVLKKYIDNNFKGVIIRPATVCGFSEKMRFDLTVNILTNFAFNKGFIKVFGGEQFRPNIHIEDMCRLYEILIDKDFSKFNGEIFNAGKENLKIISIAEKIKKIFIDEFDKNVEIIVENSNDQRSYQINSDKIKKILDFDFKFDVNRAVLDLIKAFKTKKIINSFDKKWINLSILKENLHLVDFLAN